MQTILGSGGAIGLPLAKELTNFTEKIRLASRHPVKVNPTDELFPFDANNSESIERAVKGSDVVYVTIGFQYSSKVWQDIWPKFMRNVINACKRENARLVFFDNMYMYSKEALPFMTEDSPHNPPSKKGVVRKQLNDMIMSEVENKNLTALIARAADFYGPDVKNSVLGEMVVKNLLKGKKAQASGDINKIHTFTYAPDAAKATAILGNTPDAYNQVWHVPTTKEKLTMAQWIDLFAREINTRADVQMIPKWMYYVLGVFIPVMRELPEMLYQNETDYVFDSSKFEKRFGIKATPPAMGVKSMIDWFRTISNK